MPGIFKKVQIGEIVAYVQKVDTQGGGERPNTNAAMITQVLDERRGVVNLVVWHSEGQYFLKEIYPGAKNERGTWHHIRLTGGPNG